MKTAISSTQKGAGQISPTDSVFIPAAVSKLHLRISNVSPHTSDHRPEPFLELAQYDFEMPPNPDEAEIAAILPRIDVLIAWANDIKEYALQQAFSGLEYPGFKVVDGKSNRKCSDENAVASTVEAAGFDPYDKKLLGITA